MQSVSRASSPRQEPTTRFTKLPDELLHVLSPREHMLLHALLSHRWFEDSEIYPSVTRLRDMLRWSVRTVQRTMRKLEDGGYVVRIADYRNKTEWGDRGQTSNIYRPGPALLPLLPPLESRDDMGGSQPVSRPLPTWPRKGENENKTKRTSKPQGQYILPRTSGFLETRHGTYIPRST